MSSCRSARATITARRPTHRAGASGFRQQRRDRSRRLLRPQPQAGAAQAALGLRSQLAIVHACGSPDYDAVALRRAGLHGDGDARREEHRRRMAEPLSSGARTSSQPRRFARCRLTGQAAARSPRCLHRRSPSARSGQFGIRAGMSTEAVNSSFEALVCAVGGRSDLERHGPRGFRRHEDAQDDRPLEISTGKRRRISSQPIRPGVATDRSTHQSRTSASRSRSLMSVAGTRTSTRDRRRDSWRARLDDFSRGIAALTTDLGDRMADTVVLTMSGVRARRERRTAIEAPTTGMATPCS